MALRRPVADLSQYAKAIQLWRHVTSGEWRLAALMGDVTELSAHGASATATYAARLVLEAQCQGEPVAWVTGPDEWVYPPDLAANGVDLAALPVVRVEGAVAIGRAADYLVRSGAFGLVVLDLGADTKGLGEKQLTRLLGLARKHGTAIVCLTAKPEEAPSLGSVVSLRLGVTRRSESDGRFACELRALKDKRRAPGWRHVEVFDGPPGLH